MILSSLPYITTSSLDSSDAGTPAQPNVSWTTSGAATAAAGVFVSLQWYARDVDAGTSINGTWTILAPSTATSVRAPALPAASQSFAPASNAQFNSAPRVGLVSGSLVPSYGVLRGEFGAIPFFGANSDWSFALPALPADGTINFSVIFPNEG